MFAPRLANIAARRLGALNDCWLHTRALSTTGNDVQIVVVGPRQGQEGFSELANLPSNAHVIAHGATMEEILAVGDTKLAQANVSAGSL